MTTTTWATTRSHSIRFRITQIVNRDNPATDGSGHSNNVVDDPTTAVNEAQLPGTNAASGYGGVFRLDGPHKSGDTWTYHIYARDTNPATRGPGHDTTARLDHEDVDRIRITVTATDGIDGDDADTDPDTYSRHIDISIRDENDRPTAQAINDAGTAARHRQATLFLQAP